VASTTTVASLQYASPGVVGVCHRGAAEPAGAPSEGGSEDVAFASGLPVVSQRKPI